MDVCSAEIPALRPLGTGRRPPPAGCRTATARCPPSWPGPSPAPRTAGPRTAGQRRHRPGRDRGRREPGMTTTQPAPGTAERPARRAARGAEPDPALHRVPRHRRARPPRRRLPGRAHRARGGRRLDDRWRRAASPPWSARAGRASRRWPGCWPGWSRPPPASCCWTGSRPGRRPPRAARLRPHRPARAAGPVLLAEPRARRALPPGPAAAGPRHLPAGPVPG